jgi:hypothetical protein
VWTRISRGDDQGQVSVTFIAHRTEASRWVPFAPTMSKLVYHRRQGWSGVFDIPFGTRRNRLTLGLVRGNNDDRVEEYSGYSLRVESREVATRRLGLSLEFARYTPEWLAPTIDALDAEPSAPTLYGRRTTITPSATLALTRDLRVTAGLSATELDPLVSSALEASTQVTAWFTHIDVGRRVRPANERPATDLTHGVSARYHWQGARQSTGSDLDYDQHFGAASYNLSGRDSRLSVSVQAGHLSGDAPLFARFTLGDTRSLRGWDKYAIAPAGGNRMIHQSVEYGFKWFRYFVDAGSVWQAGADRRMRVSTGIGFDAGAGFVTVGIPLNDDNVGGTLMFGFRAGIAKDLRWLR